MQDNAEYERNRPALQWVRKNAENGRHERACRYSGLDRTHAVGADDCCCAPLAHPADYVLVPRRALELVLDVVDAVTVWDMNVAKVSGRLRETLHIDGSK